VNPPNESPATAVLGALAQRAADDPSVTVLTGPSDREDHRRLVEGLSTRLVLVDEPSARLWREVERRRRPGQVSVIVVPYLGQLGTTYEAIRSELSTPGANFKILALDGGLVGPPVPPSAPVLEDVGLMATLPAMTVVAPADAASARAALSAVLDHDGPAYLRLATGERPSVGHKEFRLGVAPTIHPGDDLTLVAVGALVARAISVAEEIAQMGLRLRVLDAASVKPLDAKAILRAARETGAIVTLEDHTALAGVGAQVAALVAEHRPVTVSRLGVPDLFAGPVPTLGDGDRYGISRERVVEACLDLLRQRGKV
jgi:transketolase